MFTLKRQGSGPILTPDPHFSWESEGVFNPGIVKIGNEIVMLYRAVGEREAYISHLGLAKSQDGIHFTRVLSHPVFGPQEIFDKWATEDPRITQLGEDFYVTYVAVPKRIMKNGLPVKRNTPLETMTALLKTRDFLSFENLGVISSPHSDNKDITLFPRKINGRYYMLHRPNHWSREWLKGPYKKQLNEGLPCDLADLPEMPGMWIASSTDLLNWIDHRLVLSPQHASDVKIGPGLPPIETKDGWLLIYHHVRREEGTTRLIYSVRAALLDLHDPSRLISRLHEDILSPEMPYEVENEMRIVFPTGGFVLGDVLYVYYGASDRYVCLATGSLTALLTELKQGRKEPLSQILHESDS
jgi:predicted GH43/DUF377 family glycosyl hydrolase